MVLPSKLQQGQNFKQATVKKINQIVDYLKTQRVIGDNKTIRVNQLTSGVAISSIQNATAVGGGGSLYRPPFSLGISSLESGENVLTVKTGKIIINGEQGDRVYFSFDDIENGEYIPLPTEQGLYDVIGYIAYDPENGIQNNGAWTFGCVYMQGNGTTNLMTNSIGFWAFYIGQIEVSIVEDVYNYAVVNQVLHSDLAFYDGDFKQPFKLWLSLSNYPQNGDFVQELNADTINISKGRAVISDKYFEIPQYYQEIDQSTMDYVFCFSFTKDGAGTINKIELEQWKWFDQETSQYNLPLGNIKYPSISGISVFQVFSGMFVFNSSDKLLLNELDTTSGYLQDKLKYTIITEQSLQQGQGKEKAKYYASGKGYIAGVTRNLNKDQEDADGNPLPENLQDELFWDYTSIADYEKNNTQIIVNDKDQLKWMDKSDLGLGELDVQGSASQFFEYVLDKKQQEDQNGNLITQSGEKKTLFRYKSQYVDEIEKDKQFYFLIQDQTKMQRLTFGKDDYAVDGVMLWDYIKGQPYPWVAPEATQDVNLYCLTGVYGDQIDWTPFENKVLTVQGSFGNVFQIVNDEQDNTKKYIRVIDEFLENKPDMPFRFLSLNSNGELQLTTFSDQQVNQSLIMWQAGKINQPFLLSPPINEDKQNITYVLSGDEQALNWINIYDYTGKVKISEQDSAADYLYNKVMSEDETVTISVIQQDGYQTVDLSAPFVKVAETDETAGYLSEKLESDESVIQALILEADPDYTVVQLKLVPQGNGILVYQNGVLKPLSAPTTPSVLTFDGANFAWTPYADCENACKDESDTDTDTPTQGE